MCIHYLAWVEDQFLLFFQKYHDVSRKYECKEKNGALTASESPKVLQLVCWFYWSIYIIIIQHTKYECCCQNYKWWKEERTLL